MPQADSAITTRRALFAGALAAAAVTTPALAAPTALLAPQPATATQLDPAGEWIIQFLEEGGSFHFLPNGEGYIVWAGADFMHPGRSSEMLNAMAPSNPLRPRVMQLVREMHDKGLL